MPLTAEEAAKQVAEEIKKRGGWKPGNVLDAVIGIGEVHSSELQALLNDLLKKKGVLTPADEAAVQDLLKAQEEARNKRNKIRTRNGVLVVLSIAAAGTIIYFSVKKKK